MPDPAPQNTAHSSGNLGKDPVTCQRSEGSEQATPLIGLCSLIMSTDKQANKNRNDPSSHRPPPSPTPPPHQPPPSPTPPQSVISKYNNNLPKRYLLMKLDDLQDIFGKCITKCDTYVSKEVRLDTKHNIEFASTLVITCQGYNLKKMLWMSTFNG